MYKSIYNNKYPDIIQEIRLLAPPMNVELSLQAKSRDTPVLGYSKDIVAVRDFSGSDLMVSGIQFMLDADSETDSDILPTYTRENRYVSPYPYRAVRKSRPVICYFEAYNLINSGIERAYKVEITAEKDKSSEGIAGKTMRIFRSAESYLLSISQTNTVMTNTARELIALDLSSLTTGDYMMQIKISDDDNPKLTTSVYKKFKLVK